MAKNIFTKLFAPLAAIMAGIRAELPQPSTSPMMRQTSRQVSANGKSTATTPPRAFGGPARSGTKLSRKMARAGGWR